MKVFRILSYPAFLVLMFLSPWYISLPFLFLISVFFEKYYEGIFLALFYDLIFAVPNARFLGFEFVVISIEIIIILFRIYLKKRLFWT